MSQRPYGRLPRQLYEYLPGAYEVLKQYTHVSPYRVLGEMFGMSHQRIQQVVYQERERQKKKEEADLGKFESVRTPQDSNRQAPPRDPSDPVIQRHQD